MTPEQKEQLRHEVLLVLVERHPNALNRLQIRNRAAMAVDFQIEMFDVVSALEFLTSAGHLKKTADDLGATDFWQATAQGTLAHERSQRPGVPRRD